MCVVSAVKVFTIAGVLILNNLSVVPIYLGVSIPMTMLF